MDGAGDASRPHSGSRPSLRQSVKRDLWAEARAPRPRKGLAAHRVPRASPPAGTEPRVQPSPAGPASARAAGPGPGSARVTRVAGTIRWPGSWGCALYLWRWAWHVRAPRRPRRARVSPGSCTGGPGPGTRISSPFRRHCGCWSPGHGLRTGAQNGAPRDPSGARAHGVLGATGKCVGDAQWPSEHLGVRRPLRAGEDAEKRGPRC